MKRGKNRGSGLSPPQLVTLLELFELGADRGSVQVSTQTLGRRLKVTQQAASTRLSQLESGGFIERSHSGRGFKVRITPQGVEAMSKLYSTLQPSFSGGVSRYHFAGKLFTGFGEGGYYISQPGYEKQFVRQLGFKPFPGTLNLRLASQAEQEQRRRLQFLNGISISGFRDSKRTFGPVKCFRAEVKGTNGAALAIERTHYDDSVLEIVAPVDLRKSLGLNDGDECDVTVFLG